jgi:hypothetical protein
MIDCGSDEVAGTAEPAVNCGLLDFAHGCWIEPDTACYILPLNTLHNLQGADISMSDKPVHEWAHFELCGHAVT